MSSITVRFARQSDIPAIMAFIDRYWKKGHILSRDRDFFEWQYVHYGRVCFVLGCEQDGELKGILGFIPYDSGDKKDIVNAIWKVIASDQPFLGINLLRYLISQEPHSTIMSPGINLETSGLIYKRLGYKVGSMRHWYRLTRRDRYYIAQVYRNDIPNVTGFTTFPLHRISNVEELEKYFARIGGPKTHPQKSKAYLEWRYFHHPDYQYMVYGVEANGTETAIVVLRLQHYEGHRVLKFIDYIGDPLYLPHITAELDRLLLQSDAEFIDLYEAGLPESALLDGGWLPVEDSGNIIPNYFSPFEARNVTIHYFGTPGVVLFRGDGDQDRPN